MSSVGVFKWYVTCYHTTFFNQKYSVIIIIEYCIMLFRKFRGVCNTSIWVKSFTKCDWIVELEKSSNFSRISHATKAFPTFHIFYVTLCCSARQYYANGSPMWNKDIWTYLLLYCSLILFLLLTQLLNI